MKNFYLYIFLLLCFIIGVSYYTTYITGKESLMLRGNSVVTNIPNSGNMAFIDNLVNVKTQKLIK